MTAIVALKHNDKIYLGADSAQGSGWDCHSIAVPKIHKVGQLYFGLSGYPRVMDILRHCKELKALKPPKTNGHKFMVTKVVPLLRWLCQKEGTNKTSDNCEGLPSSALLVAWGSQAFIVESNYQITEPLPGGVLAIGCGSSFVLGSLYATTPDMDPEDRVRIALEAAATYSAFVCSPFLQLTT